MAYQGMLKQMVNKFRLEKKENEGRFITAFKTDYYEEGVVQFLFLSKGVWPQTAT